MFTKQHYKVLAEFLKNSNYNNKSEISRDLLTLFISDNQRFSSLKWYNAVGIGVKGEIKQEKKREA
jgi:hypothetical protein